MLELVGEIELHADLVRRGGREIDQRPLVIRIAGAEEDELRVERRVGGLADTVEDGTTGFLFDAYTPEAFESAAFRALDVFQNQSAWTGMMKEAMVRDFSWERSTRTYLSLYRRVVVGLWS